MPLATYGARPTYEQWYAAVGGPAGYPYAPPAQYGGVVYGAAPYAQYGATPHVAFGVAGAPKRYTIEISAPGAREIRVWQVNHGGRRHIKNITKESGKFKTWGKVKNKRADDPALIEFRVFWKKAVGGGDSTHGPIRFAEGKSYSLTRPAGAGEDELPGDETLSDAATVETAKATAAAEGPTPWMDAGGGGSAAGRGTSTPTGGLPGWVIPTGIGVAVGVPVLALVVKRLRKQGGPSIAGGTGQGARRRRAR